MNYYKRHIGDYAKKTAHLTMAEDGAYNRMLDIYYTTERPLPVDRQGLYRIVRARSKQDQAAVDSVLVDFFDEGDDGWHHGRCDEEIDAMHIKAKTNRVNGKGGGRPKKKPNDNPQETQSVNSGLRLATLATNPLATNPQEVQKSGANAPPARGVWDEARTVLEEAGFSIETSRSFIARCLKAYPDDTVKDAFLEARGTADPKAYVVGVLKSKTKRAGAIDYTANAR